MSTVTRRLFGIDPEEVTFTRRGFRGGTPEVRAHIEKIARTFLDGYHAVLENHRLDAVVRLLNEVEPAYQGFAFEGAAMSISIPTTAFCRAAMPRIPRPRHAATMPP